MGLEFVRTYWWGVLLVATVLAGVMYYFEVKKVGALETFTTVDLPNTPADTVSNEDKECAFINLAIGQSKAYIRHFEKGSEGEKVVEGFTAEKKKDYDEQLKRHKALIESYTKRQKELKCDKYEGFVAEVAKLPAPK
jgi:flagellar motility protein MotE (MotC chaperone)